MKRKFLACLLNGIMFFAIKLLYALSPMPFGGVLYCMFLGFCVTYALGPHIRAVPSYIGSLSVGVLWFLGYGVFEQVFCKLPFPYALNTALGFGVMCFIIEVLNVFLLGKTFVRHASMQFAGVIAIITQNGQNISAVLLSLVIGMFAAVTSKWLYDEMLPVDGIKSPK